MKKYLFIMMICLILPFWGCSDSSSGDDPIAGFRDYSADLKALIAHELTLATLELDPNLPDDNVEKINALSIVHDFFNQNTYVSYICNTVINFNIGSRNGNTFTSDDKFTTITLESGIYTLQHRYYIPVDAPTERVDITFVWNTLTNRWLITGERIDAPVGDDVSAPWFKQEGEWVGTTSAYTATSFYIVEDDSDNRHMTNGLFTFGETENTLQAAANWEECDGDTETCVDIETTTFYTSGLEAAGGPEWDTFKIYEMADDPDYEIPYIEPTK